MLEANDLEDYVSIKSVEMKIENIDKIKQIKNLNELGNQSYEQKEYRKAYDFLNEALSLTINNNVDENIIEREPLIAKVDRLKLIVHVLDRIDEADKLAEEGDRKQANDIYRECIDLVKTNELQEEVPLAELEAKISGTPMYKRLYVNGSMGMGVSMMNFGSVSPVWNLGITYRFNRNFAIGGGLNILAIEAFFKYSFLNTIFIDNISNELLLKIGLDFNISPLFIGFGPYGFGGVAALEYILGIQGTLGIYAGLRLDLMFNFESTVSFNIPVNLYAGIVFHF